MCIRPLGAGEIVEEVEAAGYGPVVDPGSAALAVDQSGFAELAEVVGDGRLGDADVLDVADAGFTGGGGDSGEEPQPSRVS